MKSLPLSEVDRIILRRAVSASENRYRTLITVALGALIVILLSSAKARGSVDLMFWLAVLFVFTSTFDKVLHGFAIRAHKRLIRKLVSQLNEDEVAESPST